MKKNTALSGKKGTASSIRIACPGAPRSKPSGSRALVVSQDHSANTFFGSSSSPAQISFPAPQNQGTSPRPSVTAPFSSAIAPFGRTHSSLGADRPTLVATPCAKGPVVTSTPVVSPRSLERHRVCTGERGGWRLRVRPLRGAPVKRSTPCHMFFGQTDPSDGLAKCSVPFLPLSSSKPQASKGKRCI